MICFLTNYPGKFRRIVFNRKILDAGSLIPDNNESLNIGIKKIRHPETGIRYQSITATAKIIPGK